MMNTIYVGLIIIFAASLFINFLEFFRLRKMIKMGELVRIRLVRIKKPNLLGVFIGMAAIVIGGFKYLGSENIYELLFWVTFGFTVIISFVLNPGENLHIGKDGIGDKKLTPWHDVAYMAFGKKNPNLIVFKTQKNKEYPFKLKNAQMKEEVQQLLIKFSPDKYNEFFNQQTKDEKNH